LAISFCGKDEEPYWIDIIKLTKAKVKTIDDHLFPWQNVKKSPETAAEPKKSNRSGKPKSRKSDGAKKNKKRWY